MNRLVLFDIDGTLTKGSGHTESFDHGFKIVYGKDIRKPSGQHSGMTDQQIIKKLLLKEGFDEETIDRHMSQMMEEMVKRYSDTLHRQEVVPINGAKEILEKLKERGVLLGLVTGNLEKIAYMKLSRVDLDKYFTLGGFGSDHWKRSELILLAIKRAKERFGFSGEVFYIGDSPLDIEAGKEAGVKTIGTATQYHNEGELKKAMPDLVITGYDEKFLDFVLGKG